MFTNFEFPSGTVLKDEIEDERKALKGFKSFKNISLSVSYFRSNHTHTHVRDAKEY